MSTRYNDNNNSTVAIIGLVAIVGAAASIYLLYKYRTEVAGALKRSKKSGINIDERLMGIEESLTTLKSKISK